MLEAVRTGQVRGRAALRLAVTEPRSRACARAPQRGWVLRLSWGTSARSCTAPVTDIISCYAWSRRRSVSQKILSKTLEHNAGWSQAAAVWLCAHKVPGACRMSTPCRCARSRSRTPPAQAANPRAVVEDILARASLLSAELGSLDPARPASAARSAGAPERQGTGEGSPARPTGAGAAAQEPRAGTCLPGPVSSGSGVEAAPAQAAPRRPGARTALGPASSLPADSHASVEQPVRGACDGHAQGVDPAGFPPTCTTAAPPCLPRSSSTSARGGGRAAGSVQQARSERPVAGGLAEGGPPRGGGGTAQSAARQPAGRAGPERAEADGGGSAAQEAAARPGGRDGREAAAAALDAFAAKLGRHASELQPRTRQARLGPVTPFPHELLSHSFAAAECVSAAVRARLDSQSPMRRRPLRRPTCCLGSCCSSRAAARFIHAAAARSACYCGGPLGCGGSGRLCFTLVTHPKPMTWCRWWSCPSRWRAWPWRRRASARAAAAPGGGSGPAAADGAGRGASTGRGAAAAARTALAAEPAEPSAPPVRHPPAPL